MKVTFIGGAKTVTGSCYLIETHTKKILVDCGMFQGHDEEYQLNTDPFDFNPSSIDYLLLTHAHIDHSGKIPKLSKEGFNGAIIATKATVELCGIMLPDSGHIHEIENEWLNRKRLRAGKEPVEPLYTAQEALDSMKFFKGVAYGEVMQLDDYIKIKFNDAGHMLGSSIIEMWVTEHDIETKVVFSGDLGNKDLPLLKDTSVIEDADYLFLESTYGNRLHRDNRNKVERFVDIVNETVARGGNVVIPSFAVGRTQEIIYELHADKERYGKKLKKLFSIPVYVDSPLAVSATEIFKKNLECLDEDAQEYIKKGDNPLDFPGLQFTRTAEESKMLNEKTESMIIISASGMCEAGRIKHHLKHNIWRPECTVLFVGYQAPGTLGRKIVDGAKSIKLFGEDITVGARIEMIDGFSGHADQKGLLEWVGNFKNKPKRIFIVHGEEDAQQELSNKIKEIYGIETLIPDRGETYTFNSETIYNKVENTETKNKEARIEAIITLDELRVGLTEALKLYRRRLRAGKVDDKVDEIKEKMEQLKKFLLEL